MPSHPCTPNTAIKNGLRRQDQALLADSGQRLRRDAAAAFERLNAAYRAALGKPMCVTDSYRDFATQVQLYQQKPGLAAGPGTSNHGWGLAVDLCDGAESFGTPSDLWLRANAGRYGWVHPAWAEPYSLRAEVMALPETGTPPTNSKSKRQ